MTFIQTLQGSQFNQNFEFSSNQLKLISIIHKLKMNEKDYSRELKTNIINIIINIYNNLYNHFNEQYELIKNCMNNDYNYYCSCISLNSKYMEFCERKRQENKLKYNILNNLICSLNSFKIIYSNNEILINNIKFNIIEFIENLYNYNEKYKEELLKNNEILLKIYDYINEFNELKI